MGMKLIISQKHLFMMDGVKFYYFLKETLLRGQYLGKYKFIKWLKNGNLQFEINEKQKKSIPPELIIMARHIKKRNDKNKYEVRIDYSWLVHNGHTDWCFVSVINHLVETY